MTKLARRLARPFLGALPKLNRFFTRFLKSERRIVVTAVVAWLLITALTLIFNDVKPVNSIEAVTERVRVRVMQPSLATFGLRGFALLSPDPFVSAGETVCLDGLFAPAVGAVVDYVRGVDGVLRISVAPPAGGSGAGITHGAAPLPNGILHFVATPACRGDAPPEPVRLPIWGAAAIGDDLHGPSSSAADQAAVLIEGTISVSARSSLLGLLTPVIFHVSTIPLPPGSRISEVEDLARDGGTLWAGFVQIDPDAGAMRLHAVTDAGNLKLYLPGQGMTPQDLRVGLLIPAFQDPYMLVVQIFLASLLVVSQAFITIVQFLFRTRGEE